MAVILHTLASLDGLRVQLCWADTWWVAAVLAVAFVGVAFAIERYTIDTPRAAKGRNAIIALVVLAILHVVFALGLRIAIWTPEDHPHRFHLLSAQENYRVLDEYRERTGTAPVSLNELDTFGKRFSLGRNQVRYFHDAWGRELRYDAESNRLISAGRDGEFGTERDLVIPRPAAVESEDDTS